MEGKKKSTRGLHCLRMDSGVPGTSQHWLVPDIGAVPISAGDDC